MSLSVALQPPRVLTETFCRRCGAPLRWCPTCAANDWYPLRCDCQHHCEAPPDTGVEVALAELRDVARAQRRTARQRKRVRSLVARKVAAGRCYSCGWTAETTIYRAGLCERHYALMQTRRNRRSAA